jgi:hypothetical protein
MKDPLRGIRLGLLAQTIGKIIAWFGLPYPLLRKKQPSGFIAKDRFWLLCDRTYGYYLAYEVGIDKRYFSAHPQR